MLYSDACASQNKNVILMGALMNFIEGSKIFSTMQRIEYVSRSRISSNIRKEYRKHEQMISTKDYCDILQKTGRRKLKSKLPRT